MYNTPLSQLDSLSEIPVSSNAEESIEVTLLGIVIEVNPLQPENVHEPIEVTLLGMVTKFKS